MEALAFLGKSSGKIEPLYVLHGDEAFLKRHVLIALRERALGAEADESVISAHPGDKAQFAAVWDEVQTAPFFAPRRVVIVENADPFVTRFRALLEDKVKAKALPPTGVLVLDVKLWPSNTKLAKLVDTSSTIVCKAPDSFRLPGWCTAWAAATYQKKLAADAAQLLVELTGADMGQLDQELQKLAIYVGDKPRIDLADVDQLVGRSSSENVWRIFDALADGKSADALQLLDRLLALGEEPFKIQGALGSHLRKLAQAARLATQGTSLGAALQRAGIFHPKGLANAEKHLRRLGRHRAARLYDWLLEINMGLRGESQLPERTQFERLVLRLAEKADPVTAA